MDYRKLLWKIIYRFKLNINIIYKKKISKSSPWVFISYIPEALYRKNDIEYLNSHQSKREMSKIVDVFHSLGYNVYVTNYKSNKLPNITPEIVFGLEPQFERACKRWSDSLKIYYATGAYYEHQNYYTKKRTDEFNLKYNASYPYQRLVSISNRCEIADYIFQIGSKYTLETYPLNIRNKIRIIRQSNTIINKKIIERDFSNRKDFLWLGSSGAILKGLDLAIDFFKEKSNLNLHIVGNVDDTFKGIIQCNNYTNIKFYGFLNTSSEEFISIIKKCNFLLYPSCSEGCPGSVINTMSYGVVPIVTKWAAFNDIKEELNEYLECHAKENEYYIADISDMGKDEGNLNINLRDENISFDPHPNKKGHQKIYEAIKRIGLNK